VTPARRGIPEPADEAREKQQEPDSDPDRRQAQREIGQPEEADREPLEVEAQRRVVVGAYAFQERAEVLAQDVVHRMKLVAPETAHERGGDPDRDRDEEHEPQARFEVLRRLLVPLHHPRTIGLRGSDATRAAEGPVPLRGPSSSSRLFYWRSWYSRASVTPKRTPRAAE